MLYVIVTCKGFLIHTFLNSSADQETLTTEDKRTQGCHKFGSAISGYFILDFKIPVTEKKNKSRYMDKATLNLLQSF